IQAEGLRIAASCTACGLLGATAALLGLPGDLIVPFAANPAKVARAIGAWNKAATAPGTMAEAYLRARGITIPVPHSIRFLAQQKNWSNGQFYPVMISLVARVQGEDGTALISSGAHYTFLAGGGSDGPVRKAETDACKLAL